MEFYRLKYHQKRGDGKAPLSIQLPAATLSEGLRGMREAKACMSSRRDMGEDGWRDGGDGRGGKRLSTHLAEGLNIPPCFYPAQSTLGFSPAHFFPLLGRPRFSFLA